MTGLYSNTADLPEGAGQPNFQLLAISFAYPPLAYPRSIHVARLLKHAGASTVLVCADETGTRRDETIDNGAEACLRRCLRVPFEISGRQRFLNRVSYRICRPFWAQQNRAPDEYKTWGPVVLQQLAKFMRAESYLPDILVTFGQPFTDHIIGLDLKRRYKLPWLAHFSDPWVDNPFNSYGEYARKLNRELERKVIQSADVLAFTSAETIDLVMRKYSPHLRDKTCVVPQCFDATLFPILPVTAHSKLILRYIGDFYGQRTPQPLVDAVRRMLDDDRNSLADVSFEMIGNCDAEIIRQSCDGLPVGLMTFRSPVAYSKSLSLMSEADGLLLIDAPAEVSVFLPSKLVDYAGAGRPLFGLTPPGTAATFIRQLGGIVTNLSNVEEMSKSLAQFIAQLRRRRLTTHYEPWGDSQVRQQYEASTVADAFKETLKGMLGK